MKGTAMPVHVGSRLARLIELRRRLDLEIEGKRAVERLKDPGRPPMVEAPSKRVRKARHMAEIREQVIRLEASAKEIRAWAIEHGLDPARTGTVREDIVVAYIDAHAGGAS